MRILSTVARILGKCKVLGSGNKIEQKCAEVATGKTTEVGGVNNLAKVLEKAIKNGDVRKVKLDEII